MSWHYIPLRWPTDCLLRWFSVTEGSRRCPDVTFHRDDRQTVFYGDRRQTDRLSSTVIQCNWRKQKMSWRYIPLRWPTDCLLRWFSVTEGSRRCPDVTFHRDDRQTVFYGDSVSLKEAEDVLALHSTEMTDRLSSTVIQCHWRKLKMSWRYIPQRWPIDCLRRWFSITEGSRRCPGVTFHRDDR